MEHITRKGPRLDARTKKQHIKEMYLQTHSSQKYSPAAIAYSQSSKDNDKTNVTFWCPYTQMKKRSNRVCRGVKKPTSNIAAKIQEAEAA